MQVSMQDNKCVKRRKYRKLGFVGLASLLLCSCSTPVVMSVIPSAREYIPPDPNVLYENALVVNDVGDGLNIDVRSSFDFSEYGNYLLLDVSTVYYTVGSQTYDLQSVDVAADLVDTQYISFSEAITAGVVNEWTLWVSRSSNQISFATVNNYLGSVGVSDFTLEETAINNGYGFIDSGNHRFYHYYSVYFPNGAPTEFRTRWIAKWLSVPFNNFMSGYTTAGGDRHGLYTRSEYVEYGQSEYDRGKADGYAQRGTTHLDDLVGAIVDVPINVLAGLSVFTVYDTPIVSLILLFLVLGVVLFILKKILAR